MSTFNQITAMQKLVETIARCDLPSERNGDYIYTEQENLLAYFGFIRQARDILKQNPKRQRKTDDSSLPNGDTNPS